MNGHILRFLIGRLEVDPSFSAENSDSNLDCLMCQTLEINVVIWDPHNGSYKKNNSPFVGVLELSKLL